MPQVPVQTTPTVSPSGGGMPYIRPAGGTPPIFKDTASAQFEKTGAALQSAGTAMANIQDRLDDTKVKQTTLAYTNKLTDLNTKFLATEGTNTLEGFKDYEEAVRAAGEEFAGLLGNDRQRAMFSMVSAKYGEGAISTGTQHMLKQQHAVDVSTSLSLADNMGNDAIRLYNTDSKQAIGLMKSGIEQINAASKLKGLPEEARKAAVLKYTSGIHKTIATAMLDNHELGRASRFLEANKEMLEGDDYVQLKGKIKDVISSHNYTVEAYRLLEKSGGSYANAFRATEDMPIERRLGVQRGLTHMWNSKQAAEQVQAQAKAEDFNRAVDEYQRTGSVTPSLDALFSPEVKMAIIASPPEVNNPEAVDEVMAALKMGGTAWKNFQQTRLPLLRGKLTPEALANYSKISNPGEVAQATFENDMFINALNEAGQKAIAYPKRGSKNAIRQVKLRKEFDDRILAEQIAQGRALTPQQKEAVLFKMLEPVIEDDAYRWTLSNTSRRLWQVKITDIPDEDKRRIRTLLKAADALHTDEAYNERVIIDTWVKMKQGAR